MAEQPLTSRRPGPVGSLPVLVADVSEPRPGRRPGAVLGMLAFSVMSFLVLAGGLECMVHASRVAAPMARSQLSPKMRRRLQRHDRDHEDEDEPWEQEDTLFGSDGGSEAAVINQLIQLVFFVVVCVVECITVCIYYKVYMVPTANRYVPNAGKNVKVPEELKGKWKIGTFGCAEDCGTFCCFLWCSPCTWADLWYRAGWLHETLKGNDLNCTAWQYFGGIAGWMSIECVAGGCFPCIFAVLRGGMGWVDGGDGGVADIVPLRKLFGMKHNGCSTFCEDCCLYAFCSACLGTQEYVQIQALLDKGIQMQGGTGVVVGNPVVTGKVVIAGKK